jgi:autotransporter translocation and assembly factor TamB
MALELADLDRAHLDLSVDAERLRIQPVIESLPDWTLTTKSAASLSWPKASPGLHLAARSDSALGGAPLPIITLQADLAGGGIQATEVRIERGLTSLAASGGWSNEGRAQLRLEGQLDLDDARRLGVELGVALPNATGQVNIQLEAARDDAGRLEARGRLGSKKLRIESAELQQLGTSFSLAGMLPFPTLSLEAKWGAAQRDSITLTPGRLRISGKPSHYAFELESGALTLGSVAASGWFEPGATSSRLALEASGKFKDEPWQIQLEPLEILPQSEFRIPRLTVVFAAQRARLSGTYSPTSAELGLDFADVELDKVLAPFEIAPGLRGKYTGHLAARGTLERPRLQLELTGARIGREHGPTLDARLKATLDVHTGAFELDSRLCESPESAKGHARLALGLRAGSRFEAGAAWLTDWRDGEHNATLELQHLDHHILADLLGKPLPVSFGVQGALSLVTHAGVPELHWKGSGVVAPNPTGPGSSRQARSDQVIAELDYNDGRLQTSLALQDAEGQWLTGKAHVELPPGRHGRPQVADLLQQALLPWSELVERATWNVELKMEPRGLERWPLPASLVQFGASKLGARLSVHGQPQSEPRGTLELELSGVATRDDSTTCVTRDWRTSGQVEFANGDFHAQLSGYHGQDQLLQVSSDAHFELLPHLRGQAPPAPRLLVLAKVERLPLAGLPFVCERARGLLSATLQVKDPLGDAPGATLDLRIAGFSLGSQQGLDVHAEVAVDPSQLVAHGTLAAEKRISTFELRLPVRSRDEPPGSNADAAIHGTLALQALPLAPLVPKDGPLSHVSGTATGNVQLQGTNGAPRLSGQLKLEEGAFTATALAQPLSNIDGEISFADDVILLKKLSARDGDGELTIDGRVKLKSKEEFDGSFQLTANKFPLRQAGQVMATTSANAQVQAVWGPTVRDLRIQLKDFDTWLEGVQAGAGLALDAHPDLVIDDPALRSETSAVNEESSASSEPTKFSVQIDAGQQFWVRRADFAIKLSANLEITVDEALADQPDAGVSVTGQLQFDRGYLELLGRVFDLERGGKLHFTGGTAATIDLSATYLDRRSEKTVKVQISGSATSPKLDFFLEGTRITAGEAFTAIYGTETTSSSEIEDTEAQAKAFVSALTAGMIATTLRKKLGAMAPIVMVTPGDTESSGQLRAGFEADALIPDFMRGVVTGVYLEGIISSDKSTSDGGQRDLQRGVSIDVHFPHNLFTSGRYGPDTTWSLDFGWQP